MKNLVHVHDTRSLFYDLGLGNASRFCWHNPYYLIKKKSDREIKKAREAEGLRVTEKLI